MLMVKIEAQPLWVSGTPVVTSTGYLTINMNYGINVEGTVYIIVYNFNNTAILTSSYVRSQAILGSSGTKVATATLSVKKTSINTILQTVINVIDPDHIHTIYIVAANAKNVLQASPVRLTASTQPCPQVNAGSGGNECDLTFRLNAVRMFGTGTWTRVSGPGNAIFSPNANTPAATVTVSAYGTYVFRWTEVSGACSSYGEVTVNFYRQPSSNAGSGGNTCGLIFTLSAELPAFGTGTWSMTSGSGTAYFSPNSGSNNATVTVSDYGSKVFTWTVVNGTCSASSSVTVIFYEQPVADAGAGGNNCGLETYLRAVPSVGTGTWTRVSGPGRATFSPGSNIPDPKVTVSQYGTYVFRWTEVNGDCTSSSTITISFIEQISANAGNGGTECDRDFNLNAVPGTGIGTWTKVTGPGTATFTPNANQYNARVTVSQYGDYDFAWTEVNNACSSVDIIKVIFQRPPLVNAGEDKKICKGRSVQLMAEGSGSFTWSPARSLNDPSISNPVATPDVTTLFTVTLTDQWGCLNTDQVMVEVYENPVSYAGPDQNLDYVFESLLNATPPNGNETGEWSVLQGSGDFENKNNHFTVVSNLSLTRNIFLWTVTNDVCPVSVDSVEIVVNDLVIPTLITPNMDGKNDFLIIKGIQSMGKTRLTVFNRWGAMVYSDENYSNNWYGIDSNAELLPSDTYFFILKPEKNKEIKGYIVIKR